MAREGEPHITLGDSIYEVPTNQRFDVILTNPPFGTKGANQAPARDDFAAALARSFDRELERWRTAGIDPLLRRWLAAAHPMGTALTVHEPAGAKVSGAFAGLGPDGSLLLRLEDGSTRPIHAGDVMLA